MHVCYPLSDMMLRKSLWFVRWMKRMQENWWKDTRPRSMVVRSREAEETRESLSLSNKNFTPSEILRLCVRT